MQLKGQHAWSEEMSACLAQEADHALKVSGHLNAGSAFDRFNVKVKQTDYDDADIMSQARFSRSPADLLFETPAADPSGGKKRRLEGTAPFRVWPAKPSGTACTLVRVSVTASPFGNGAAASMMEFDLLPAEKGEAHTRLYASPGSFAFGITRHDVLHAWLRENMRSSLESPDTHSALAAGVTVPHGPSPRSTVLCSPASPLRSRLTGLRPVR